MSAHKDKPIAERYTLINDAADGLYEAVIGITGGGFDSTTAAIAHGVRLLQVGLCTLADIADAQQRMAALAERDIAGEIEAIVNDRLADAIRVNETQKSSRSFIGKQPKDA